MSTEASPIWLRWSRVVQSRILSEAFAGPVSLVAFRWVVVAGQAATLLFTWPLWAVHAYPPMLPWLPLPELDVGPALLTSLAFVLLVPKTGVVSHCALLAYAFAVDQTRLQPTVVSLAFLLLGTLHAPSVQTLARTHLVALWFYAGVNKLLSPTFLTHTASWLLSGLMRTPPQWLRGSFGYAIAIGELALGLLMLWPRTRKVAAVGAFGMHAVILYDLSPWALNWNRAVWPWNVVLALAGFALVFSWKDGSIQTFRDAMAPVKAGVVFLLLSPLTYHVGWMDAYLAHHLYTANIPKAYMMGNSTLLPVQDTFSVPLPPERRLYIQYFERTCFPGDRMTLVDPRPWFQSRGQGEVLFECEKMKR